MKTTGVEWSGPQSDITDVLVGPGGGDDHGGGGHVTTEAEVGVTLAQTTAAAAQRRRGTAPQSLGGARPPCTPSSLWLQNPGRITCLWLWRLLRGPWEPEARPTSHSSSPYTRGTEEHPRLPSGQAHGHSKGEVATGSLSQPRGPQGDGEVDIWTEVPLDSGGSNPGRGVSSGSCFPQCDCFPTHSASLCRATWVRPVTLALFSHRPRRSSFVETFTEYFPGRPGKPPPPDRDTMARLGSSRVDVKEFRMTPGPDRKTETARITGCGRGQGTAPHHGSSLQGPPVSRARLEAAAPPCPSPPAQPLPLSAGHAESRTKAPPGAPGSLSYTF